MIPGEGGAGVSVCAKSMRPFLGRLESDDVPLRNPCYAEHGDPSGIAPTLRPTRPRRQIADPSLECGYEAFEGTRF